jgi:hypothetical protein
VNDTQLKLAKKRTPKLAGMPPRRLGADKNFAVLKCDYVGRSGSAQKLPMQVAYPPIRDKQNKYFA